MRKNIKLLLESLFDDDFDEIYDEVPINSTSQQIGDAVKITSLGQCDNADDVDEYFINKYNLQNMVINTITDVMSEIDKCTELNEFKSYKFNCDKFTEDNRIVTLDENSMVDPVTMKYDYFYTFKCFIGPNKDFSFQIAQQPYEITYRNKQRTILGWYVVFNDDNKILWKLINLSSTIIRIPMDKDKDKNGPINNFIDKLNQTQFSNVNDKISSVIDGLKMHVKQKFKTQRIANELNCEGKVYKVTQKDIDRMNKCLDTRNFSGFDKITKSDKMVARLAALFICAKNRNIKDLQLQFNDDILLSIILGHGVYNKSSYWKQSNYGHRYSSRINMNSKEDFINILKKLQNFPDIHLKDVIATYNAYKEQF